MSKPDEFNVWPYQLEVDWEYRAVAKRIIDGDTLYLFVDLGLNQYAYKSIRLYSVQAPELFRGNFRDRGQEAKAQLEIICPPETKLRLATLPDRSRFGTYVGILGLQNGALVNDLMIDWLERMGY